MILLLAGHCYLLNASEGLSTNNVSKGNENEELSLPPFDNATTLSDDAKNILDRAKSVSNLVSKNLRLIDKINPKNPVNMPLGIETGKLIVAFDSMKFTPSGGVMTAYFVNQLPKSTDSIGFAAKEVKFGPTGIGDAKMQLIGEAKIDLNNENEIVVKDGSSVTFGCQGFKEMNLDCEAKFSESFFKTKSGTQLSASFKIISTSGFSDVMTNITINQPFEVSALPGFTFEMNSMSLDLSDTRNPANIVFPKDSDYNTIDNKWQGFYADDLKIILPQEFNRTNQVTISAKNFIIDTKGFSGSAAVAGNLIPDSKISGWEFSIHDFALRFKTNLLDSCAFSGSIKVPLFGKGENEGRFDYKASIDTKGDYLFRVDVKDDVEMNFDLLSSKVKLFENSYIEINRKNGKFIPKAVFNGLFSMSNESAGVKIEDITFSNLMINSEPFDFSFGEFSLRSKKKQSMSNFPITVGDIGFINKDSIFGIKFVVKVNLADEKDKGFSADAGFTIKGKLDIENGVLKDYKFVEVDVHSISVEADVGVVKFKGMIESYDLDKTYGNGYYGYLDATFSIGLQVKALGQFGSVDNYRYWYVDANVIMPGPLPLIPGFGLYGFGGGAYYHMSRAGADPTLGSTSVAYTEPRVGVSLSGQKYIPDIGTLFGFKASVEIGVVPQPPKAFNGNGTLEFKFGNGMKLLEVSLLANAYFMTDIDKRSEASTYATLTAQMHQNDANKWELDANCEVFINMAGVVQGSGTNYSAGNLQMHFGSDNWFIYMGKPDKPIGLKVNPFSTEVSAYFVVGTKVPGMPDIGSLTGNSTLSRKVNVTGQRDISSLNSGSGFGFGAKVTFETGYKCIGVFCGEASLIAGFDVMIKNYGSATHCQKMVAPVGIKGWYATGQIYAAGSAKIDIDVDLTFVSGRYNIFDIQAYMALQAQLPNPTYLSGVFGGNYSILGGLVSGECSFDFDYGEKCKVETVNEIPKLKAIKSISPSDGDKGVSLSSEVKIDFSKKVFPKDNVKSNLTIVLVADEIKLTTGGNKIDYTTEWNEDFTQVVLKPKYFLERNAEIDVYVKVSSMSNSGGELKPLANVNGAETSCDMKGTFRTEDKIINIDRSNIENEYPLPLQANVYLRENGGKGFIYLNKAVPGMFRAPESSTVAWKKNIVFIDQITYNEVRAEFQVYNDKGALNDTGTIIEYTIQESLLNNKIYKYMVSLEPETSNSGLDAKILYTSYFRTSSYNTFNEKMNDLMKEVTVQPVVGTLANKVDISIMPRSKELFDVNEVPETDESKPMVTCEFLTDEDPWYTSITNLFTPSVKVGPMAINMNPSVSRMTEADARIGVFNFTSENIKITVDSDFQLYKEFLTSGVVGQYTPIQKNNHKLVFNYTIQKGKNEVKSQTSPIIEF
jgi:hypothetical protein